MDQVLDRRVWFARDQMFSPSTIAILYDLNGGAPNSIRLGDPAAKEAEFILYVDKTKLHIDQNVLKVSAKGRSSNKSKESEIIINIGGGLQFGNIQDKVSFVPVMAGSTNEIVQRQDGWQVEVVDSRSNGRLWQLQAQAGQLVENTTKTVLDGNVVYKEENGKLIELNHPTTISSNVKDNEDIQTIDVASTWKNKHGILLKVNNCTQAGSYEGKIYWSLVDSM
ncbi:hypothetical protein [Companilactobacillus jidongensis]|uniref:hypothetical protein n=1 Tax=Companilactobacillus jidongensis TaxID=2486006 RepID=UPI000F76B6F4|nr:hypothetical protein [Companilactobacillus jidongensis]